MCTFKSFAFIVCLLALLFSQLSNCSVIQARNKGFTVDLIARDSPLSPYYNHSDTKSNRLRNSFVRSISRANHFRLSYSQKDTIQSDVLENHGEYLMKLSIGTPPVNILAILDTGSNLVWTQCKPCEQCYKQDAPLFDSSQSSTYKEVSCDSTYCQAIVSRCGVPNKNCEYRVLYGDQSYTYGDIGNDTITFVSTTGQAIPIPNFLFGCGHNNDGIFDSRSSGIVGLGGGPLSLVSQLSSETGGKFSYCLVPTFNPATSKLNFGDNAIISSVGKVSTPLVLKDDSIHYYLTLEGISVGDQRIDTIPTTPNTGNILIDSGTVLTLINEDLSSKVDNLVKAAIKLDPAPAPNVLRLCYNTSDDLVVVPEITFHFTGADVKLNKVNTLIEADEGLFCLGIVPNKDFSIFGSLAQVNLQVEYDLQGKQVSFAPTDCTKL